MKKPIAISISLLCLIFYGVISVNALGPIGNQQFLPIVVRSEDPTPTPTVPPTATPVTPTAVPVVNTGKIDIPTVHWDGSGSSEPDEYVEIRNNDTVRIQVQGWTLKDNGNIHSFTFPNFIMDPGKICRIYTNQSHPEYCGFNFGNSSAIWNNTGDCATLRNSGGTMIDQYCY